MDTPPLIRALLLASAYPHPAPGLRLIETHISWVLIAGDFAYKIKKPVNYGFLDFSSLEKRRHCCAEEIRLNRRLAPATYLDVVAIHGTPITAHIDGQGPILEYAVKMRAFPADATLDREACITAEQIDAIARRVAEFHAQAEVAPAESDYGDPDSVMRPVRDNFRQLRISGLSAVMLSRLDDLEAWSEAEASRLEGFFQGRKREGFIRECHGDLHLGNIAWVDGAALIFDCIEFNPRLRLIDVISETAFMVMDLLERGHPRLAWRYLNRYLEYSGDYAGLTAWRFYLVYRALVRAKVGLLRAGQDDAKARAEALRYLDLAEQLSQPGKPRLWLMHGVSGSGKSWLAQELAETHGALCLRSDIERKRLYGLRPLDSSASIPGGIYTPEAGQRTFARLGELADALLGAGFRVIVDATFLKRSHRQPFIKLAQAHHAAWRIVSLKSDPQRLRQQLAERAARADDASEADVGVMTAQLAGMDSFTTRELPHVVEFDQDQRTDWPALIQRLAGD